MELILGIGAGALLGILSGMGIGGGSLLILFLTLVRDMDPLTARGISLLFFFPATIVSCLFRKAPVSFKDLLPAIASGIAFAALFSYLSQVVNPEHFKKAMGVLLIGIGLTELFHREKPTASENQQEDP